MSKEPWREEARIVGGAALVEAMENVHADLREVKNQLAKLARAFPADDIDGHRVYHEAIIERNRELRRLRVAIQEKTISGLVWIAIVWLGTRAWGALAPRIGLGL